jgi:hypothetical protein
MKRARSPRVQNQRANTIININNLKNYFSATPKPEPNEVVTQAEEPAKPEPMRLLDSEGKRVNQEMERKNPGKNPIKTTGRWIRKWHLQNSGELRAGCYHCRKSWISMERFAPDADSENSAGKSQRFHAALAAFRAGHRVGDEAVCQAQLAIVLELRTTECDSCREKKKLSPAQRACKDEWDRMRQEACRRQNGCANQDCPERGMAAWVALQADHGTNDKVHHLGHYKWWAEKKNGGVEGMREELKKNIHQFICGVCHALEPTSAQGRRETSTTPDRQPGETDRKYNKRCRQAEITVPKYDFVDARKAQIGHCQYPGCGRVCTLQNAVGFNWDHRDQSTKRKCRCPIGPDPDHPLPCQGCEDRIFKRKGGVAGLAHNHNKETALDSIPRGETVTTRELLEAEMVPKCDLLCIPCHLSRKPSGRARDDPSV